MESYRESGELRITKNEERLLSNIAPIEYLDQTLKKAPDELKDQYLIDFLQDELREVLQSFLNGGLSTAGYVAYPFMQNVSPKTKEKLLRVSAVASLLQKRGRKISPIRKPQSMAGCASALASLYQNFEAIQKKGTKVAKKNLCEQFDLREYGTEYLGFLSPLQDVQKISRSMENGIEGLYLHGSLATNDFVKGWSDCDTLCVVSTDTLKSPKRLLSLRSQLIRMRGYCCQIDPLQHHGASIITKYDLDSYPQTYFPLPLFDYAKSFGKDNVKEVRLRQHTVSSYAKLFWFVSYFRRMQEKKNYSLNAYETKNLLHLIALFPSLYLQAKGVLAYKKFSFGIAKKDFSKELWQPIEEMTVIRSKWKQLPTYPGIRHYAKLNPFVAYQINAKLIDKARIMKRMAVDTKTLIEGVHLLSEEAWRKAVKRL